MKTNSFKSMGSLHPILFFTVVYVVALVLSVFICSSLFYTFNGSSSTIGNEQLMPTQNQTTATTAASITALR